MLPVTVWMNMPSFYQSDLFRSLGAQPSVDLQVVFARPQTGDRQQLGWRHDVAGYPHVFLAPRQRVADAVRLAWRQRHRVQIVNGVWAEPAFTAALVVMAAAGSPYAIYSEASAPRAKSSVFKPALQQALAGVVLGRAMGVFAVSRLAVAFFRGLGARTEGLFPFGYFRARAPLAGRSRSGAASARCEVLFVGQLIERKGPDLLLDAMAPLFAECPDLTLAYVGCGLMQATLERQVAKLGLAGRVRFDGVVGSDRIPGRIAEAALLVLPSRWDGWGLVVNEALVAGVPVIVSDHCGAADLICEGSNGSVFRSDDVRDLRSCLRSFLAGRARWPKLRECAAAVGETITTERVAPYMVECLEHMSGIRDARPRPPWERALDEVQSRAEMVA